jgi:yecA family protein
MTGLSSRSFYASVSAALAQLDSDLEPAECHGVLCGMLCSPDGFDSDLWLQHVTGYPEDLPLEYQSTDALHDLVRRTLHGMESEDLQFELLLPDDDESLVARTDALGCWCRGFLSGFGITRGVAARSAESQEFLGDLYRISQVDPAEVQGEVGERAFLEIVEYARMGAILLREENRDLSTPAFNQGYLH